MRYIVDRKTWYRGQGSEYSRLLTNEGNKRCCIGFVCAQRGIVDESMLDVLSVGKLREADQNVVPDWFHKERSDDKGYNQSDDLLKAYSINDASSIRDDVRERDLKAIFVKHGDSIEFVN